MRSETRCETGEAKVEGDDTPAVQVIVKINSLAQFNISDGTFFADITLMLDWIDPKSEGVGNCRGNVMGSRVRYVAGTRVSS